MAEHDQDNEDIDFQHLDKLNLKALVWLQIRDINKWASMEKVSDNYCNAVSQLGILVRGFGNIKINGRMEEIASEFWSKIKEDRGILRDGKRHLDLKVETADIRFKALCDFIAEAGLGESVGYEETN